MPTLRRPLRLATLLFLTPLVLMVTGCLTVRGTLTSGTEASCIAVKVIRFSKNDTPETVQAIKENNAALRVLCPDQNPPAKP